MPFACAQDPRGISPEKAAEEKPKEETAEVLAEAAEAFKAMAPGPAEAVSQAPEP